MHVTWQNGWRTMSDSHALVARMAQTFGIPGLCVALYANGRQEQILFGEDAQGSELPVTSKTWFQAASTGKHVTAAVILDLERAGLLSLDHPLGRYLPDAPQPWHSRTISALLILAVCPNILPMPMMKWFPQAALISWRTMLGSRQ